MVKIITWVKVRLLTAWSTGMIVILASACSSTDGVEITEYPMLCESPVLNDTCSGKVIPLNRSTYRVFASSQQVVEWMPGIRETPIRLEQFAVRDASNWKCYLPRDQGEVGFVNGEYIEKLTPPRPNSEQKKFFYVGGMRWWWEHL